MGLDVVSLDFFRSARDMSLLDKIEITLKICVIWCQYFRYLLVISVLSGGWNAEFFPSQQF